jgi:predicted thioesterase
MENLNCKMWKEDSRGTHWRIESCLNELGRYWVSECVPTGDLRGHEWHERFVVRQASFEEAVKEARRRSSLTSHDSAP